jgi:hypothetical protein
MLNKNARSGIVWNKHARFELRVGQDYEAWASLPPEILYFVQDKTKYLPRMEKIV